MELESDEDEHVNMSKDGRGPQSSTPCTRCRYELCVLIYHQSMGLIVPLHLRHHLSAGSATDGGINVGVNPIGNIKEPTTTDLIQNTSGRSSTITESSGLDSVRYSHLLV